jgi:hypothetical protein
MVSELSDHHRVLLHATSLGRPCTASLGDGAIALDAEPGRVSIDARGRAACCFVHRVQKPRYGSVEREPASCQLSGRSRNDGEAVS